MMTSCSGGLDFEIGEWGDESMMVLEAGLTVCWLVDERRRFGDAEEWK